jgi:hypothetical protein
MPEHTLPGGVNAAVKGVSGSLTLNGAALEKLSHGEIVFVKLEFRIKLFPGDTSLPVVDHGTKSKFGSTTNTSPDLILGDDQVSEAFAHPRETHEIPDIKNSNIPKNMDENLFGQFRDRTRWR